MNKKENPLISILINVVLPYLILTKGSKHLGEQGPLIALILGVSLPLLYGSYDFIKNKKTNYVSVFGLLNTLFTGGFALLQLNSTWFIVKEAAFPFVLGVMVYLSSLSKKPVIKFMFNFSQIMNLELIQAKLNEKNLQAQYDKLLLKSNNLFSVSFFISALLNFLLAYWVFKDIDPSLNELQKMETLNKQIADMWWMGYVVIALPLTFFLMYVMYALVNGIKSITGLELEQIFPTAK